MKHRIFALTAAVLLLGASPCFADDENPHQQAAGKAKASPPSAKSAAKPKAAPKIKPVDINSAKREELKKLPGIGDAEADKIIAGRPYGSKAWLVSHDILPDEKYSAIQNLVIAKQPFKDAGKNLAALKAAQAAKAAPKK